MKRTSAAVWINPSESDRRESARDDIRGLAIAKALSKLSAECEAYRARIRHELRKARGKVRR